MGILREPQRQPIHMRDMICQTVVHRSPSMAGKHERSSQSAEAGIAAGFVHVLSPPREQFEFLQHPFPVSKASICGRPEYILKDAQIVQRLKSKSIILPVDRTRVLKTNPAAAD